MPELPEVETIARALREGAQHSVVDSTITDAVVLWERSLATPTIQEFKERIPGQSIRSIGRRGKYIVFTLSSDTLLVHLRMSGDVRVEVWSGSELTAELRKHDRAAFSLDNGQRMVFEDARKFGRIWLLADPQEQLSKLGPEPFDQELTPTAFHAMLQAHKRQLKPLLMDQSFLAGLGNIYTDESLFKAKLHPLILSNRVTQEQAAHLLDAIRSTLQEGIHRNGASIDWVYRGGDFQNHFYVYGRKGEECQLCGAPIERIVVGQRGTHFCPACQSLHEQDSPIG